MASAVNIPLSASNQKFLQAMQEAAGAVGALAAKVNINLANSFKAAEFTSKQFEQGIGKLADKFKNAGQNLTMGLTLPIAAVGVGSLKMAADMEQAAISFRVLLKDANLAASALEDIKNFSASTPFEFPEVQTGAKQLLAYGFALKDVKPLLTDAGNLASGMGVQLTEVTRVMGRLKSGDFGEAFERLRDFGIGRDSLEGKGLKFDASNAYKGSVRQAMEAVREIIQERFGGQMEQQSKSMLGVWSNIKEQAGFALADIGKKMAEVFNFKELGPQIAATIARIREGFNSLSPPIQKAALIMAGVAAAAGPLLIGLGGIVSLVPTLVKGWGLLAGSSGAGGFGAAITAITGPVGLAVAAVVGLGVVVYKNWDGIKSTLKDTGIWDAVADAWANLKDLASSFFGRIKSFWSNLWDDMKGYVLPVVEFLKTYVSGYFTFLKSVLVAAGSYVLGYIKFALNGISGVFKFFAGVWQGDVSKMGDGLKQAFGGIWNALLGIAVTGVRTLGLVLERGLEAFGLEDSGLYIGLEKFLGDLPGYAQKLRAELKPVAEAVRGIIAPTEQWTDITAPIRSSPLSNLSDTSRPDQAAMSAAAQMVKATREAYEKINLIKAESVENEFVRQRAELQAKAANAIAEVANSKATQAAIAAHTLAINQKLAQDLINLNLKVQEANKRIRYIPDETPLLDTAFGKNRSTGLPEAAYRVTAPSELIAPQLQAKIDPLQTAAIKLARVFEGVGKKWGLDFEQMQAAARSGIDTVIGYTGSIAESIGANIGQKGGLKNIFADLIGMIADSVIQLGKSMIKIGAAISATGVITMMPELVRQGTMKSLGGVALVVAGAAAKAMKFADGGVIYGPTFGMMGEYAGASRNPEIVGRFDQFQGLLQPMFQKAVNMNHTPRMPASARTTVIENVLMLNDEVVYRANKNVAHRMGRSGRE